MLTNGNQHSITDYYRLVANLNFIKNERQTFVAIIGAIAVGIITILVGVCVLILPLGITDTLSISLGVLGIAIGSVVIAYSLRIIYVQAALRRKHFIAVKHAFNLSTSSQLERNTEPILSLFFPYPLDALTYGKTHCMGKAATWISLIKIVLGISAIVGSVLCEVLTSLWFRTGISLTLASAGGAFLVSGLASVRAFNLNAQGVLHLYFARYMQEIQDKGDQSQKRVIESLTSRVNLLESHLNQSNLKVADLTTQLAAKQAEIAHIKNRSHILEEKEVPTPPRFRSPWSPIRSTASCINNLFFGSSRPESSSSTPPPPPLPPIMIRGNLYPMTDGNVDSTDSSSQESDTWYDADIG
ncbi:CPSIT_0556 family inclusion membrane protein [Chlamydia avium]|uniref:Inner membrane protein n=1 Tax=Chlamydia avium TaxID=1457141 RepID=A0ABP2X8F9_9CHLA|nr:hypothetical protein [Chlamydia avium]EPP35882.1 hypothetical protein CP10743SC13_0644 [Chlamydia psittaci 10_743_SC13]EPP38309.1 hypothetical protein CP10881SC42_0725 [Chlamydia avium]